MSRYSVMFIHNEEEMSTVTPSLLVEKQQVIKTSMQPTFQGASGIDHESLSVFPQLSYSSSNRSTCSVKIGQYSSSLNTNRQEDLVFQIHVHQDKWRVCEHNLDLALVTSSSDINFKNWCILLFPSGVIKWVWWPIHTHTNPWGRLKWSYAIIRLSANFICGLMSDLVIYKFRKSINIHDTDVLTEVKYH